VTGPQHYRAAEKGIEASTWQRQKWGELEAADSDAAAAALEAVEWELQRAQVHATLALAAATADPFALANWAEVLR
jgi:hypothetical protein